MPTRLCLVNAELVNVSPDPFRPTTSPYPTSRFSRTPSKSTMSLMRDWAVAVIGNARIETIDAATMNADRTRCRRGVDAD